MNAWSASIASGERSRSANASPSTRIASPLCAAEDIRAPTTALGLAGAGLVLAAAARFNFPGSHRSDVLVLLACWFGFELARENAGFSVRLGHVEVRTHASWDPDRSCKIDALPKPVTIATHRLTGRISKAIFIPGRLSMFSGTRADWFGHIDTDSWSCYLPFHRSLHVENLVLRVDGGSSDLPGVEGGSSHPPCHFTGDLRLTIDASWTGTSSCRDLEDSVARQLGTVLSHATVEIALGRKGTRDFE